MTTTTWRRVKVSQDARGVVDTVLARADGAGQAQVEQVLARAAGQNKDRFLTTREARAVADAFERVGGTGTGALNTAQLTEALALAEQSISALADASNVDGVSVHFTFQERLSRTLVTELDGSVARAAGRRLDVNMMIFEFQSDEIEEAVVRIARDNPHVTFRIIADSGQAADYGGNALPSILKKKLPNVQVKFKKDFPYAWDAQKHMPRFNHGSTQGLLHHKGFATFVDGMPDRLVAGSYNWSNTADQQNYEDLTVFHAADSSARRAVEGWGDEFAAFFNNADACLSPNNFANFKKQKWNDLVTANGGRPLLYRPLADDAPPAYQPARDTTSFDVNGYRPQDAARLADLVGKDTARAIAAARKTHGRFDSLAELQERVPAVAALAAAQREALTRTGMFGSGQVSINTATADELDAAGFSGTDARAIVAWREQHGDFEALEDLGKVPGITRTDVSRVKDRLSAVDIEAFFNSRPFGSPAGGTGYGSGGTRTTPVMGEGGAVAAGPASVVAAATDLFNRAAPGQSIRVAMYGMSAGAPEYKALVAAARRGVDVKVILNSDFTASTVAALKALQAQGLPIDVRIQAAKTMHEKFGVVGDDVFAGSANFSESSSTKHSENRFAIKNDPGIAGAFGARFDDVWSKSRPG
ncbi:MAG: helix-hairpin-helix domain-containing protein [Deltaproteobacteria bacterium]|nr:helix-hairpin-helix domain-containing protein [Deltaproteobacteria bacterium]